MEIHGCPTCEAPATVAKQTPAGSVRHWDHVFLTCARGHWFLVPAPEHRAA